MKNILKVFIPLFMMLLIAGGCAKKEPKYFSDFIWKPETEEGRKLKLLYQDELIDLYKELAYFNFPVQKSGIGFTISEKCQTEGCTYEELNKLWLFIASPLDDSVSANTYNTFEARAEYIIEKRLPDILLPLQRVNLKRLLQDKRFDGIMVSFTWQAKEFPKEMIGKGTFETARIYIPKGIFAKYGSKDIDINELINNAEVYLKLGPYESKRITL